MFCQDLFNEGEGHTKANIESCTSTFYHQLHCHDLIQLQFFREKRWNFSLFTKNVQINDVKDIFKKSSLNFQNLFKEKDRSFSVFNLFLKPQGKKMCVRGQTWFHTKVEQRKRKEEEERKKNCSYLCVLHFTNLWARWIWKKNIPHSFPISGSLNFVENHQIDFAK